MFLPEQRKVGQTENQQLFLAGLEKGGGRAKPLGHLEGQVRPERSSSRSALTCSRAPGAAHRPEP